MEQFVHAHLYMCSRGNVIRALHDLKLLPCLDLP